MCGLIHFSCVWMFSLYSPLSSPCEVCGFLKSCCIMCSECRMYSSSLCSLPARKLKVIDSQKPSERCQPAGPSAENVSASLALNVPSLQSLQGILERIEPVVVNAGHDSTQPDSAVSLLTSLNQLGERQLVSVVKWAKGVPGKPDYLLRLCATLIKLLYGIFMNYFWALSH